MTKTTKNADQPAPRRVPYRKPKLRAYGSIQSITLANAVKSVQMDGAGGGGKTVI